jgi:hypothetical protein
MKPIFLRKYQNAQLLDGTTVLLEDKAEIKRTSTDHASHKLSHNFDTGKPIWIHLLSTRIQLDFFELFEASKLIATYVRIKK